MGAHYHWTCYDCYWHNLPNYDSFYATLYRPWLVQHSLIEIKFDTPTPKSFGGNFGGETIYACANPKNVEGFQKSGNSETTANSV